MHTAASSTPNPEKTLGNLHSLMRSLLAAIPHAVIGLKDRRIVFANPAVKTVFGWRPEELIGQTTRILYRSDRDYEDVARRFYPILANRKTYQAEFPCRRKDQRDITCMLSAARVGSRLRERMIIVTYEDITRRQEDREALRESEQFLKMILSGSPIATFVIGRDHRIMFWNRALEELTKIPARKVVGTRQQWRAFYRSRRPCMADLIVDQAHETIAQWYAGTFSKSNLIEDAYEATDHFPALGEGGKWLRFTAAAIRNSEGQLVGAIETLEDITQRQSAEEALRKAHEHLELRVQERTAALARVSDALQAELAERRRAEGALKQTTDQLSLILESLPIVSFTCRPRGRYPFTFVSSTIEELTGYAPRQFLEKAGFWQDRLHPDDRSRVLAELKAGMKSGTLHTRYRFQIADDGYRWFSDNRRLITLPDGASQHIVGAWQDITEETRMRQEAELRMQQMIQTHKLTALGEVVAGVAHEINNPVSFIAYNAPLLEEIWSVLEPLLADLGPERRGGNVGTLSFEEVSCNMREIIEALKISSNRISRVISSLKDFARADEPARTKPVQISEVIQGALTIVGAQVRKTVSRIELAVEDNLPLLRGHFQKIEQVITNLLINAHQAMPPGRKGTVRITARHVKSLSALAIEIEDNGRGMEREVLSHLFDPFFTTRRDWGGTGLGLSISYGLIREHNGLIGVLSRPGMGSRFLILLPLNGQSKIELRPAMLCVDHDRGFVSRLKANFVDAVEYPLTSDCRPGDIVAHLLEHPEIDLVLAEIDLPGEGVWAVLDQIKRRFPLLPVILYSRRPGAGERKPEDGPRADFILKKPFRIDQLQKIIRETRRQRL